MNRLLIWMHFGVNFFHVLSFLICIFPIHRFLIWMHFGVNFLHVLSYWMLIFPINPYIYLFSYSYSYFFLLLFTIILRFGFFGLADELQPDGVFNSLRCTFFSALPLQFLSPSSHLHFKFCVLI